MYSIGAGAVSDQLEFVVRNLPNFLIGFPSQRPGGLLMSLILAVVGLGAGFVLALAVAPATGSRHRLVRWLGQGFVEVFRGVPLILLLLLVHQLMAGVDLLGIGPSTLRSAFVALMLYSAAYQADIIATGFRAIPPGLIEDARLLGSSRSQLFALIKLPYGLRVMQPALTGQAITLFKDTSVVIILGVADLTATARIALGSDVTSAPHWVATYLTVGAIYFVVAFGFSVLARWHERRIPSGGLIRTLAEVG